MSRTKYHKRGPGVPSKESAMITRKTQAVVSSIVWPYTPEPSPRLAPVAESGNIEDEYIMSGDESRPTRPISLAVPRDHGGTLSPGGRPTLDDVLNNRAPQPFTLSAYMAFLSQQHCLETLAFTEKYDAACAHMAGMPLNYESDEGYELQQEWTRILEIYIKPGAPQEINLPSEERDDLLDWPYGVKPPPPEALDPSVKRMYDLMSDSIFIPFCNSLRPMSYAQTYNALSDLTNVGTCSSECLLVGGGLHRPPQTVLTSRAADRNHHIGILNLPICPLLWVAQPVIGYPQIFRTRPLPRVPSML
jgi:hypothetical protein